MGIDVLRLLNGEKDNWLIDGITASMDFSSAHQSPTSGGYYTTCEVVSEPRSYLPHPANLRIVINAQQFMHPHAHVGAFPRRQIAEQSSSILLTTHLLNNLIRPE
ncbi:MAG: hypothetical protein AB7J46_06260 [Candidatus Altimarinota bacterium]